LRACVLRGVAMLTPSRCSVVLPRRHRRLANG
jgi:hypothetical protein